MTQPRARRLVAALVVPLLAVVLAPAAVAAPVAQPTGTPPAAADTVLVRVADGRTPVVGTAVGAGWFEVPADNAAEGAVARRALGRRLGVPVLQVQQQRTYRAQARTGDPDAGLQWGLDRARVTQAWRYATGAGVRVAVLDTGVSPGPDLGCRTFHDDVDMTRSTRPAATDASPVGHGTHVAGTIAQCTGNGIGTAGVARDAGLLDVQVLRGASGTGSSAWLAAGINRAVDRGADVVNLSLACDEVPGTPCHDPAVDSALERAERQGVVVVAASGNGAAGRVSYPASHPTVLAVGAHDVRDRPAWYSNGGSGLDLLGPGGSGDPGLDDEAAYIWQESTDGAGGHELAGLAGTSMAAPHVAGIAALVAEAAPAASPARVRSILRATACRTGLAGSGAGLVQAEDAVRLAATGRDGGGCFEDVPLGRVFQGDVAWLADRGITRGCNDAATRFCPASNVTRGQMAAFLVRALGLPASSRDRFRDDDDSPFEAQVQALAAAGITRGCNPPANTRFCPDAPVTRAQMAAFLVRALGLPASSRDQFRDDDDSIFEAQVQALARAGVTRGCNPPTNDRFCPGGVVTREQMAAFLRRGLG